MQKHCLRLKSSTPPRGERKRTKLKIQIWDFSSGTLKFNRCGASCWKAQVEMLFNLNFSEEMEFTRRWNAPEMSLANVANMQLGSNTFGLVRQTFWNLPDTSNLLIAYRRLLEQNWSQKWGARKMFQAKWRKVHSNKKESLCKFSQQQLAMKTGKARSRNDKRSSSAKFIVTVDSLEL